MASRSRYAVPVSVNHSSRSIIGETAACVGLGRCGRRPHGHAGNSRSVSAIGNGMWNERECMTRGTGHVVRGMTGTQKNRVMKCAVMRREDRMHRGTRFCAAVIAAAAMFGHADLAHGHLGNFPDAVILTAEFDTWVGLIVNGVVIPDGTPGFLFRIQNTSFGDGMASSFEEDPDGDFANMDVLTPAARAAISAAQPFGLYGFGVQLPTGAAPSSPLPRVSF